MLFWFSSCVFLFFILYKIYSSPPCKQTTKKKRERERERKEKRNATRRAGMAQQGAGGGFWRRVTGSKTPGHVSAAPAAAG